MATTEEETQAKEFLKRAEIRTMKKDLLALREIDALKERDKIAKIKTLDEQLADKEKAEQAFLAKETAQKEKREEILTKNEGQERIAEKDLKNYASEEERQKIFLFESQRLAFEKQIDAIDMEKEPALKLEKNKLLLIKRDWQAKLDSILEQEKKLDEEEKFIADKERTTTIPTQRKALEQSRWDLDKKIQDVEKKRWEAEKQIKDTETKVSDIDKFSDQNITEKNQLKDKVLGVDKSLREIYSAVMVREEERRSGKAKDQLAQRENLSKAKTKEKEKVQRDQWFPGKKSIVQAAVPKVTVKERMGKSSDEELQREKFLEDVDHADNITDMKDETILPPPPVKRTPIADMEIPVPKK